MSTPVVRASRPSPSATARLTAAAVRPPHATCAAGPGWTVALLVLGTVVAAAAAALFGAALPRAQVEPELRTLLQAMGLIKLGIAALAAGAAVWRR
jgi:hypothetical protein